MLSKTRCPIGSKKAIFTRPLLPEGSSLQVEILFVCLSVCLSEVPSSLWHFQFKAFKSSQNHVRPHILYTSLERGRHQQWQVMTMTKTKTNTKTKTKTKTKLLKDPTYAIFLKMIWLKDINYDHDTYFSLMPQWWQWQRQTQIQRQRQRQRQND